MGFIGGLGRGGVESRITQTRETGTRKLFKKVGLGEGGGVWGCTI